jgi:hypothetical protein
VLIKKSILSLIINNEMGKWDIIRLGLFFALFEAMRGIVGFFYWAGWGGHQ